MQINNPTYTLLARFLKDRSLAKGAVLYKGDKELEYLISLLRPETSGNRVIVVKDAVNETALSSCSICPDIIERKPPFGSGTNRLMIILNAPGMASRGEIGIYRKESVELLKRMVAAIGLELKECYVTNLIKCESSSPLLKPSDMVKNCTAVLQREIESIRPLVVLVMGDIIPIQGIVNSSSGITWFNTEHTISLIRNPDLKRPAWETLKLVRNRYQELADDSN